VRIGNIVHQDVPVSNDEAQNEIVRQWGNKREEAGLKNHVDLMNALGMMDCAKGTLGHPKNLMYCVTGLFLIAIGILCGEFATGAAVAGNRGYFLKGSGVLLKMALEHYAMNYLARSGYEPTYAPFFMTQSIMSEVAQLEQFDEELYKVTGEGEDKYLIATSEQPIAALHRGEWLEKQLPIK
jgi:seryl-tRNA synthetase